MALPILGYQVRVTAVYLMASDMKGMVATKPHRNVREFEGHPKQRRFDTMDRKAPGGSRVSGEEAKRSGPGDVNIRAECADNLAFMRQFDDGSIQLIITSPPYNLGKSYESRLSIDAYLDGQAAVIAECVRLLRPQGSICWQVGNHAENGEIIPLDVILFPIFRSHGLQLRNRIVWQYGHGQHEKKRLSGRYETINWWTKTAAYTWHLDPIRVPAKYPNKRHFRGPRTGQLSGNPKGKNPSDVWEIPNVKSNHVEKTIHPCQFPVELVERLVLSMSDPGDAVLDPYMGVGSSLIAAAKHGRTALGCDTEPVYVDIARERLAQLEQGTLRTRPMGKPIYDPSKPNGGH